MGKYEAEFTILQREVGGLRYRCENCRQILSKVESHENVLRLILDTLGDINRSLAALHETVSHSPASPRRRVKR